MQQVRLLSTVASLMALATLSQAPAPAQQDQSGYQPPMQYGGQPQYASPQYPASGNYGYPPAGGYAYPPGAPAMSGGYAPQTSMAAPPATQRTPGGANTAAAPKGGQLSVPQWFQYYDQIRHKAQMSPQERQRADSLLSRGLSVLIPGDEKLATKQLLGNMVARYQGACQELKQLPQIPQTSMLHHSYYNYFASAGQLFTDYIRVQDNLFVTDAATGQPVASSLIQRKQMLEALEHQCKMLDGQTRSQFGVAPYPW